MRKLFYAAVGTTLTLLSASPALAQDVQGDLENAVAQRVALAADMRLLDEQTAGRTPALEVVGGGGEEVVLGEQALPIMGIDAPLSIKLDLLAALRAEVAKNRGLGVLPTGGSTD
jgi:hypothetical protein